MDISGIIGILLGFGLIFGGYLIEGGHMSALVQLPSFLIVFGGTTGLIIYAFPLGDISGGFGALGKTFSGKVNKMPEEVIEKVIGIANVCRSEGLLKLQSLCDAPEYNEEDYLTLKLGMMLALDMKEPESIESALNADIEAFTVKRKAQAEVFGQAGGFLPTLGVLGTVMSLVHVLGAADDPSKLVAGIAGAFLATLYGVGFANLIFLPSANRIKIMLKKELLCREMMVEGICMIVKGENARSIENKLSVYYQAFPGGMKKYKEGINK